MGTGVVLRWLEIGALVVESEKRGVGGGGIGALLIALLE